MIILFHLFLEIKKEENERASFNKPLEEEEYSKLRKISSSEKANEDSTISHSRKSTLDIDEELNNVCIQRKMINWIIYLKIRTIQAFLNQKRNWYYQW